MFFVFKKITEGYLFKKGTGKRTGLSLLGRRNWTKRWFVIDTNELKLSWYTKPGEREERGSIALGGCRVEKRENEPYENRFNVCFFLNSFFFSI